MHKERAAAARVGVDLAPLETPELALQGGTKEGSPKGECLSELGCTLQQFCQPGGPLKASLQLVHELSWTRKVAVSKPGKHGSPTRFPLISP